jgi:hypothetical protein
MTTIWHWIKIGILTLLRILASLVCLIKNILEKSQKTAVEVMSQSNPESINNSSNDRLNNILRYASEDNQNSEELRQKISENLMSKSTLTSKIQPKPSQKRPGYPNTYPLIPVDPRIERPEIFDPALWHFSRAGFRLGEPVFQEPHLQEQWLMARQQVIEHLLCLIQDSPWHEHLVLRGSLLLKVWLENDAREPGDIDWVFRPITIGLNDPLAQEFFQDLIERISRQSEIGNVTIEVEKIATDDIWTYERAQGRRILFPWKVEGLPDGTIQMDITFGEELFIEPIPTLMTKQDGSSVSIWSVTPALSLAWKLRWLEADRYPQGKDLYDAVLLAESVHLSFDLLRQVLENCPEWCSNMKYFGSNFSWRSGFPWFMEIQEMEWDLFLREYPWVEGTAINWLTRLQAALVQTLSETED